MDSTPRRRPCTMGSTPSSLMIAAVLLTLLTAAEARGMRNRPPPDQEHEYVTVGDPGNPPNTDPIARGSRPSGRCADGVTYCQTDSRCERAGAPTPCTTYEFPPEFQERGSVDYEYEVRRYPVSTEEWVEYLNDTDQLVDWRALEDWDRESGTTPVPLLVSGSRGTYEAVRPDYAWPYSNPEEAQRFANWKGTGDPDLGAYDCRSGRCSLARRPGARIALPTTHEWRKAAEWDPDTRSWWEFPGGGGGRPPVPGVDANVGGSPGVEPWPANCIGSIGFERHPSAECRLVPIGRYPHYASPWGVEDLCGHGMEPTESPGELYGEVSATHVLLEGTIPLLTSLDCTAGHLKQGWRWSVYAHTKVRLVRLPPPRRIEFGPIVFEY